MSANQPATAPGLLHEAVAIITGGASGMGLATAKVFAGQGARVVTTDLISLDEDDLPDDRIHYRHDVGDEVQWNKVVAAVVERFGRIDVLVNNAGIVGPEALIEQSLEDFEKVLRTNLVGAFLGIKTVGRVMAAQRGGSIVNISSLVGTIPSNNTGAYSASKWGIRGLSRVAALELARSGVRVNVVLPGLVDTPLTNPHRGDINTHPMVREIPMRRAGLASEVANASLYFASARSSFCNGAELAVDGGNAAGRIRE